MAVRACARAFNAVWGMTAIGLLLEILVGATFGALHVRGAELRLCCMSRSQLVIRGSILGLRMEAD